VVCSLLLASLLAGSCPAQGPAPTRDEALAALRKCVSFYVNEVGATGPYVWCYSGDLTIREGEGKATPTIGWVQPPGMPGVGWSLLDAYGVTGEEAYRSAAVTVAH